MDTTGSKIAWEYADLIKGDFNVDSKDDYALLVKPYNYTNGYLVVLLTNELSYDLIKVTDVIYYRDHVLYLAAKGSELYNYDSGDTFIIPSDGITLCIIETSGETYYMVNGKFVAITTSD